MPRGVLFFFLILVSSAMLFLDVKVPNKPTPPTKDLYKTLMSIPEGSTVFVQSDWTLGTRGESGGQMDVLLNCLMERNVKFAVFTIADVQAPQVARDWIARVNEQRKAAGKREYKRWSDWISLGYFPNGEGTLNSFGTDLLAAISSKKDVNEQFRLQKVMESPVLQNVKGIGDVSLYIVVTASGSINTAIERLYQKVPLAGMVTGVMGPEAQVYYATKQLVGLSVGLKGVLDMETMSKYGINVPDSSGVKVVDDPSYSEIKGFVDPKIGKQGEKYYPTLHGVLTLMILAVIAGNVGMLLTRKAGGR